MADRCRRIADSGVFQGFILVVIVLNAITLGIQTYDVSSGLESVLTLFDEIFLVIFVVEIATRVAAFGGRPQDFFRDGWNIFDFVVVGAALLPGVRENITLLRIVRLLRVLRVVTVFPTCGSDRVFARSIPLILSLIVLTLMPDVRLRDGRLDLFGRRGIRRTGETSGRRCSRCSRC